MTVTSVYRVLVDLVLSVEGKARPLAFADIARRSLKTTTAHLYVPAVTLPGPLGLESVLLLVLGQTVRGTALPLLVLVELVGLDIAHRDMVV
jgi:hypothetical protein